MAFGIIGYENGNPIYGYNNEPVQPSKEVVITGKKPSKWYDGLFDNAGEIFTGAAALVGAFKGQPGSVTNVYTPPPEPEKDNTIIYAAVALIVIIIIIIILKTKKA